VEAAKTAFTIFRSAIEQKTTSPMKGKPHAVLQLTCEENRDAIRNELVRIIHDYGLEGCKEEEISEVRLKPLSLELQQAQSKPVITINALACAYGVNNINWIARSYYEDFPQYKPLYEMVDNLAKTCCTGAAQTIGSNLPPEIVRTWPYFSKIFAEAKNANTWLWPTDVEDCVDQEQCEKPGEAVSDIAQVQELLKELGYDMMPYGAGVALMSVESGYSHAETASHLALATLARDAKEAENDIMKTMQILVHARAMLSILAQYRNSGLMRQELYQNDGRAMIGVAMVDKEQGSWIETVLSDPIISKERVAKTRINYDE
jgi:hypothetical protein